MSVLLPLLVPLTTAVLCLVWPHPKAQRYLSLTGALALVGAGLHLLSQVEQGVQTMQMGNWPAPFGITFAADHLSALMVLATGVVALSVILYALGERDTPRESLGYHPLTHFLLAGVNGAFLTGDLFNLYVWFEVLLLASFVLMVLGGGQTQLSAGVKYFALSLLSSILFLTAIGMVYGATGALNLADLATRVGTLPQGLRGALAMMFLVAFGLKAAVFPFFFWLPATYPAPPVTISALFAGLLTKVGVYALIRVFALLFPGTPLAQAAVLWVAGLTLLVGALMALAQGELRRILSFQLVSHIGYMLLGLGLFSPLALTGSIFYALNHMLVITALFLTAGLIQRLQGGGVLVRLGGLYRRQPWLAVGFLMAAFSLAGLPPLSGFWAKFTLVVAGLEAGQYALVAVALLVGLLTLLSIALIFAEAFWKEPPQEAPAKAPAGQALPLALLALMILGLGLWAEPLLHLSQKAAWGLLEPSGYIQAVLGVGR